MQIRPPRMTELKRLPLRVWVRLGAVVVVFLIGMALAVSLELPSVPGMRSWLEEGSPTRWLAVVLGLAVALLTPISRSALSVLVGAVAGFPAGLAVALSGGLLGGLAGFALSRWLGREAVIRLAGARLARLDLVVSERGFLSVLAARIMPVAPFVVVSYAAGLSGVRFRPYLLGTAIGLVPWSVLYVGIGASATSIGSRIPRIDTVLSVAGVLSLALLTAYFWWRRKRRATQPDTGRSPAIVTATPGQGADTSTVPPGRSRS